MTVKKITIVLVVLTVEFIGGIAGTRGDEVNTFWTNFSSSPSPINIPRSASLLPTFFIGIDMELKIPRSVTDQLIFQVENERYGPKLVMPDLQGAGRDIYLSGGLLRHKYVFHNMRFQWNSITAESEHKLDGKKLTTEVHAEFVKDGLTLEKAKMEPDGFVEIVFFAKLGGVGSTEMAMIIKCLMVAKENQASSKSDGKILPFVFESIFNKNYWYYIYVGSRAEVKYPFGPSHQVIFIVLPTPFDINNEQVKQIKTFQTIYRPKKSSENALVYTTYGNIKMD